MATNILSVNVYEINGIPRSPIKFDFPATGFTTLPYNGSNYNVLYSVVRPFGVTGDTWAVVETQAQLQTLANS